MTVLVDNQIIKLACDEEMISPFYVGPEYTQAVKGTAVEIVEKTSTISRYLTSCGYDATLSNKYFVFKDNEKNRRFFRINPKSFNDAVGEEFTGFSCLVPPHGFVLASTAEYFKLPKDIFAVCYGKSTYARCGLHVSITPIEPGFEGNVVLELTNFTDYPISIETGDGIAQFMFHRLDRLCSVDYSKKKGKYQGQRGVTLPK